MFAAATVFVVDADAAFRCQASSLLVDCGLRFKLYRSATEFLEQYPPRRPGCLLLDAHLIGMDADHWQQQVVEGDVPLPAIMVSADEQFRDVLQASCLEVLGFVKKPIGRDELIPRVRMAILKDIEQLRRRAELRDISARFAALSPREREIVQFIVQGWSIKEIAALLGTSHNTVKNQRARIHEKTNARCDADVVRMALTLEFYRDKSQFHADLA